jgi:flavin-dependent dehydrogenase
MRSLLRERSPGRKVPRQIEIAGAGPSGLAAALTVARAGQRAVVSERHADVAARFHGDFQGIENYSTRGDALEELAAAGVAPTFNFTPFSEAVLYDDRGREWRYRSPAPLFYMIRRGTSSGMLDATLKQQALSAGVEIRFNTTVPHEVQARPLIRATGPRDSFAIVVGYIFKTTLPDLVLGALSDRLAPKGYAYLVTSGGVGTVASCLFIDLRNHRRYLDATVAFFTERTGLVMEDARRFGGTGTVRMERTATRGQELVAGEAAGFQDALWGFGLRYAMISGHLAARAVLEGRGDYDQAWRSRLGGYIKASFVNRYLYEKLGNPGYNAFLSRIGAAADAREWLRGHYAPSMWKSLWSGLVARSLRSRSASSGS